MSTIRRHVLTALAGLALLTTPALAGTPGKALDDAVAGSWRSAENKARDQYRHPVEALAFWGLKPGMTILEINPGGRGWWTEILAPYAKATGGHYAAAMPANDHAGFYTATADKAIFGEVKAYPLSGDNYTSLPANSAELVLVARAFHGWARQGETTDNFMAAFYGALKPGGILAVEQHRAPEGSDPQAGTGYVPESYVIAAARKAGFVLEDRSEINANPKDTRDHPFGVWTLKPNRNSKNNVRTLTDEERAAYDAIGESDRMTLRFRKPL
jgi:predicted methyltransferase